LGPVLKRYLPFIRNAFLTMLAYRLRYFTGIITYFVFVSVHYFIWQACFHGKAPGESINGFTFEEMITYIVLGWISRSLYFSDIDEEIDDLVRTGQITNYLLRPVNFQLLLLSQAFGSSLFRASFFTLPLSVFLLLVFPILPPASVSALLYFLFSTFISFLILAELNFIIGLLAFSLKSIQGIIRAKYFLIQLFSGLLLPLSFFPEIIRRISMLLPFQTITYIPLRFYLGKVSTAELPGVIMHQTLWAISLFLIGKLMWHRAMERLTVQGG
jgi:ABC-2 type transport system permease protein